MWGIDDAKNIKRNVYDEEEEYDRFLKGAGIHSDISNDGYMIPYNDNPYDEYNIAKHLYLDVINRANDYVYIFTPYLILDNETVEALCYAGNRGVDVAIIVPHIPDKKYAFKLGRNYYEKLMLNKVKIYEYTPGFVHSKTFLCDDRIATIGTVNLDFRSLYLHFEDAVYMYKNSEVYNVEEDFQNTLSMCQKITWEDCKNYSFIKKLAGAFLKIIAPLM
jgi:cardiolipin synthase